MTTPSDKAPNGAVIAQRGAMPVDVEAGEEYWWCACGRSKTQPFCDGSHEGTAFEPVQYVAETSKRVFFCGCKATKKAPICDASHNKL